MKSNESKINTIYYVAQQEMLFTQLWLQILNAGLTEHHITILGERVEGTNI